MKCELATFLKGATLQVISSNLWTGLARKILHTELFPSLLSYEGAFSGVVDDLIYENFLRYNYERNMLKNFLLQESLKIKICPCGGAHLYTDVPPEVALPPLPRVRAGVSANLYYEKLYNHDKYCTFIM